MLIIVDVLHWFYLVDEICWAILKGQTVGDAEDGMTDYWWSGISGLHGGRLDYSVVH